VRVDRADEPPYQGWVAESIVEELTRYVQFGERDEEALRALHAAARPRFEEVATRFYERILAHPKARSVLEGGESRVGHLRVTLVAWMDRLLAGPWDEEYWKSRERIGRVHVRVGLPQHYMLGGMNVIRSELELVAQDRFLRDPDRLQVVRAALHKILDLELAVMLHTYRDDLLAQQARTERLATYGQLVGSIGHELRNPLAVITSSLYILGKRVGDDPQVHKHLERISDQVAVANGIVLDLLDIIHDRPLVREPVRLPSLLEGLASSIQRPAGVTLVLDGLEGLPPIDCDPGQLRQLLTNLVENAVQATTPRGEVRVRVLCGEEGTSIQVEDNGPGVDPAIRHRLFEPLITTRASGIGLGLALVKRIAERHGGSVLYSDRPGGGARFTVHLPARP